VSLHFPKGREGKRLSKKNKGGELLKGGSLDLLLLVSRNFPLRRIAKGGRQDQLRGAAGVGQGSTILYLWGSFSLCTAESRSKRSSEKRKKVGRDEKTGKNFPGVLSKRFPVKFSRELSNWRREAQPGGMQNARKGREDELEGPLLEKLTKNQSVVDLYKVDPL